MKVFDRVLAVVLAVALFAAGVVSALEIGWTAGLGKSGHLLVPYESAREFLRTHTWDAAAVRGICLAAAAVGLLLLAAQLKPRRPGLLAVHAGDDPAVTVGVARRSLSRGLAAAATDVDGISGASAKIGGRRAKVTATSELRDVDGLQPRLQTHLEEWIAGLRLIRPPRLSVHVKQKER